MRYLRQYITPISVRNTLFFLGYLAVSLALGVVGTQYVVDAPRRVEARVRSSIDKLVKFNDEYGRYSGGTGFQVIAKSGRQYTMTNAHVCRIGESQGKLQAMDENGRYLNLSILEIASFADLCLLAPNLLQPSLKVSDELDTPLGASIFVAGHPKLMPLTITSGLTVSFEDIIIGVGDIPEPECKKQGGRLVPSPTIFNINATYCVVDADAVRTSAQIYPGNSGSPLLNSSGEVVGVMFAGSSEYIFSYAVRLRDVHRFLNIR